MVDNYFRSVNTHLLGKLPTDAEKLLEMGCGAGYLGRAYKERVNPDAWYAGLELVEQPAREARTYLDHVLIGNVEALENNALGIADGDLDCLIYGDVLEHLISPWDEIAKRLPLLKKGGRVCACIPNVAHWSVQLNLLRGHWPYAEHGLLDITHLRFFTLHTMVAMFKEAGLTILDVSAIPLMDARGEQYLRDMQPAVEAMKMDVAEFRQNATVFQYILVTQRP